MRECVCGEKANSSQATQSRILHTVITELANDRWQQYQGQF